VHVLTKNPPGVAQIVNALVERFHGAIRDAEVTIDILEARPRTDDNGDVEGHDEDRPLLKDSPEVDVEISHNGQSVKTTTKKISELARGMAGKPKGKRGKVKAK
jgi:hypothetical protein